HKGRAQVTDGAPVLRASLRFLASEGGPPKPLAGLAAGGGRPAPFLLPCSSSPASLRVGQTTADPGRIFRKPGGVGCSIKAERDRGRAAPETGRTGHGGSARSSKMAARSRLHPTPPCHAKTAPLFTESPVPGRRWGSPFVASPAEPGRVASPARSH